MRAEGDRRQEAEGRRPEDAAASPPAKDGGLPVAILAGGRATRLGAVAAQTPKLLVEAAGEPFFNHQLRLLRSAGLTRLVLCVGHLGGQIVDRYGDGAAWGVHIDYSFDGPIPLGTGGALVRALPQLGGAFYVLYGDSYLPIDYWSVGRTFLDSNQPALMTVFENRDAYDTSNVWFEGHRIRAYSKSARHPAMRHIDYGLGVFRSDAFDGCPRDAPFDLADLQSRLAAGGRLAGCEMTERFYEIGSPGGLAELAAHLDRGNLH